MKASAEKSSSTVSRTTASQPFFAKAGGGNFFAPVNRAAVPAVQAKMTVGKTGDKFEREADKMADKVMRMPSPASSAKEEKVQRKTDERLQKAAKPEEKIQKKEKQEEKIQKAPAGDKMMDKVMRMPSPASSAKEEKIQRKADEKLQKKENEKLQKAPAEEKLQKKDDDKIRKAPAREEKLQRKSNDAAPAVSATMQSAIRSKTSGGQPLSADVRRDMESRFNADFSKVRIHSNAEAAGLSNQLSARAFTHRNHIFFSRNQYQPGTSEGKQLLAHELTHTIQQGHAVQRSPQVSTTITPPVVQRWSWPKLEWPDIPNPIEYLINKAKGAISEKAESIYGFPILTMIIGRNPITGVTVDRSPGKILKAAIDLIPGGESINQALENHKVFDKISVFAAKQFDALKNIGSNTWQDIKNFLTSFSKADLLNLGKAFDTAKGVINARIDQIKAFAIGLKDGIVTLIKDLILKPLAAFIKANSPNGYDLLCAVLGKDPISGEPVPQTAENLIGPFMKLIGQEEVWGNMQKAKAIPRAWAWFQKAMATVKGYVTQIPGLAIAAFKSLVIADIVMLPNAFNKIKSVFGGFVVKFVTWAGNAVWNLLEIIFDAVSPGALGYIKKTGSAIKSIFKNPIPFVGNLVKAAKQGFLNFSDKIGTHLKAGLIDWLVGSLQGAGVYIPKALNLAEMGKFALSVLGITWAGIRKKIVKALGDKGETIVGGIEKGLEWAAKGFETVKKLMDGGIDAAWEMIKEKLTDMKDTVVEGIKGFVVDTIVTKAVPKLVGMFIPGAGFLLAIKSIYDTIMVFVNKISKIIQVVTAFIDSIVTIAAGNITAAANSVEKILGGLLSLAISFLAGFLSLGNISDKIKNVIDKIRDKVDKAIDKVIEWIVTKAKALFGKVKETAGKILAWWKIKKGFTGADNRPHTLILDRRGNQPAVTIRSKEKSLVDIISEQTEPKKTQLRGKYEEVVTLAKGSEEDLQQHQERHHNVQSLINEITLLLGPQAVRPTVVTHSNASGGRANRVIADPLTKQAGNTSRSSTSSIQFKNQIEALAVPRVQEQHFDDGKTRTRLVFSMFSSSHLLAERIHGPAEPWNLANTGKSINGQMIKPEEDAEQLTKRGAELAYTVTAQYHSTTFPPTDRQTLGGGTEQQKRDWLGGFVAKTYTVNMEIRQQPTDGAPLAQGKSYGPFDDGGTFLSSIQIVDGAPPRERKELVYEKANETAIEVNNRRRVRGFGYLGRELHFGPESVKQSLKQLANEKRLIFEGGQYYFP